MHSGHSRRTSGFSYRLPLAALLAAAWLLAIGRPAFAQTEPGFLVGSARTSIDAPSGALSPGVPVWDPQGNIPSSVESGEKATASPLTPYEIGKGIAGQLSTLVTVPAALLWEAVKPVPLFSDPGDFEKQSPVSAALFHGIAHGLVTAGRVVYEVGSSGWDGSTLARTRGESGDHPREGAYDDGPSRWRSPELRAVASVVHFRSAGGRSPMRRGDSDGRRDGRRSRRTCRADVGGGDPGSGGGEGRCSDIRCREAGHGAGRRIGRPRLCGDAGGGAMCRRQMRRPRGGTALRRARSSIPRTAFAPSRIFRSAIAFCRKIPKAGSLPSAASPEDSLRRIGLSTK